MGTSDPRENGTGLENAIADLGIHSALSADVPYDKWVPLHVSGWRPSARYKHAAEVVHEKLYIIGGSRNGRYLSDIQVFDLRSLTWSEIKQNPDSNNAELTNDSADEVLPAIAGHSLVKWDNKLLVVAGNSKGISDTVRVWSIDPKINRCLPVKTYGKVPIARGGQSVTLVGSKLIMFGGEDNNRRLLNDLHILDLETMSWDLVETMQTFPSPRFDHTAAAYADRYLLIFGGCSHSAFFNDLHVLDLHTMDWSEPQVQGEVVNSRAGHAGTTIGGGWYIVGGGDNKSGTPETIKLNMSKLVWVEAARVPQRDPLASEGLSLCSATVDGEQILVAFGGYNGKYHNEVFVLKPKPSASTPPRILRSYAAAAAAASVTAAYALTTTDTRKVDSVNTNNNEIKEIEAGSSSQVFAIDISALSMEKKMLEARLADVRDENLRLKGDLSELNNSHKELSMELESVQGQLEAERSRCFKLELQVAEIHKILESRHSIEQDLEVLRRQNSSQEDYMDAERKNSSIWQRMTGAT